jgi:hypothetical protein
LTLEVNDLVELKKASKPGETNSGRPSLEGSRTNR